MNIGEIIIAITTSVVVVACSNYPNLWWLIIPLGLWIVLLQVIAISDTKWKHTFFKYTDYAYYLIIGVAVFVSTKSISGEMYAYLDALEEKNTIRIELKDLRLRERSLDSIQRLERTIIEKPREKVSATQEIDDQNKQQQNTSAKYPIPITSKYAREHTKIYTSTEDFIKSARNQINTTEPQDLIKEHILRKLTNRESVDMVRFEITRLENKLNLVNSKDIIFTENESITQNLLYITGLFIFGIAIKIGKTTCSLREQVE